MHGMASGSNKPGRKIGDLYEDCLLQNKFLGEILREKEYQRIWDALQERTESGSPDSVTIDEKLEDFENFPMTTTPIPVKNNAWGKRLVIVDPTKTASTTSAKAGTGK